MKVMVSACLLGENCKYNGGNNLSPAVLEYVKDKEVFPICPEMMAGLGCPRTPIEIVNGTVMDRDGNHVDAAIREAAARALEMAKEAKIDCAVLKSRSPTCGARQVYDGSFSGRLVDGAGVFAQALMDAGIPVLEPEDV